MQKEMGVGGLNNRLTSAILNFQPFNYHVCLLFSNIYFVFVLEDRGYQSYYKVLIINYSFTPRGNIELGSCEPLVT